MAAKKGTSYCRPLVRDFYDLADDLGVSKEYLYHGRGMANEIFRELKENARDNGIIIDRTRMTGSTAKGTGISFKDKDGKYRNPDFDQVVFLNDEEPPFDDALDTFHTILEEMELKDVRKAEISVKCGYKSPVGLLKFDVLPAENFVNTGTIKRGEKVGDLQAELALENLVSVLDGEIDPHQIMLHSASFCQKGVDMIKEYVADKFYLDVVRLAKYWDADIDLGSYLSGRSSIIELIAINSQRGYPRKCLISGFRRFLEDMKDMSELYVILQDEPDKDDPLFSQVMDATGPIIIDPGCVYDNIAEKMDEEVIAIYEEQAKRTLKTLHELRNSDGYSSSDDPIDEIFSEK